MLRGFYINSIEVIKNYILFLFSFLFLVVFKVTFCKMSQSDLVLEKKTTCPFLMSLCMPEAFKTSVREREKG